MTLIRESGALEVGGDGRTVDVRLVPWETWGTVSDDGRTQYSERFARDSLEAGRPPLLVRDTHENGAGGPRLGAVIGHIETVESRPDGAYASLRIAQTPEGRRTLALVENGTVRAVSIEFTALEDIADGPGQVTRHRARLDGVAFAAHPAHDAPILAVRTEPDMTLTDPATAPVAPTPDAPAPAVAALEADPPMDEPSRARAAAATLAATAAPAGAPVRVTAAPYPTYGHYVRAVARRDPQVEGFTRALASNITSESPGVVPPGWVREVFGIVEAARPTWQAFAGRPLPDTGMVVNYPQVTSKPQVGVQATQKTEIPSRKFSIGTTPYPVETYAGGENVALQLALRSDPSYTDALWRAFAAEYAAATDQAFITAMLTAATQAVPVALDFAASTAAEWWDALTKGAGLVMRGCFRAPDVVVMAVNVWEILAGFTDADGRPIYPVGINGPTNAPGQTGLSGPGNLGGIDWVVDPWAPTDFAVIAWSGAMEHLESPGAPIRLEATEPSLLGREMAVYGFVASAAAWPLGMAKLTEGTPTVLAGRTAAKGK